MPARTTRQESGQTGGAALRGRHRTVLAGTEDRPTLYVDAHPARWSGLLAEVANATMTASGAWRCDSGRGVHGNRCGGRIWQGVRCLQL